MDPGNLGILAIQGPWQFMHPSNSGILAIQRSWQLKKRAIWESWQFWKTCNSEFQLLGNREMQKSRQFRISCKSGNQASQESWKVKNKGNISGFMNWCDFLQTTTIFMDVSCRIEYKSISDFLTKVHCMSEQLNAPLHTNFQVLTKKGRTAEINATYHHPSLSTPWPDVKFWW